MTTTRSMSLAAEPEIGQLGVLNQLRVQVGHVTAELWRVRVVFIFTFLFPLTWLVMLGLLAGNDVVDPASGVRLMQFMVPTAAAMGVLYATFPTVAASMAWRGKGGFSSGSEAHRCRPGCTWRAGLVAPSSSPSAPY